MNEIPEKLKGEPCLRQWVLGWVNLTHMDHLLDPKLHFLPGPSRRKFQNVVDGDACFSRHKQAKIRYGSVHDDLQMMDRDSIRELGLQRFYDSMGEDDVTLFSIAAASWVGSADNGISFFFFFFNKF